MEFTDISDVGETSFEVEGFHGGEIPPAVELRLEEVSNNVKASLKRIDPRLSVEFGGEVVEGKVVWSIGDGIGKSTEIQVELPDGKKVNFGDAMNDSTVEPQKIVDSFVEASKGIGLSIPNDVQASMLESIENSPVRALDEITQAGTEMKSNPSAKAIASDPAIADLNPDTSTDPNLPEKMNKALSDNPEMKKMASDMKRISDLLEKNPSKVQELEAKGDKSSWSMKDFLKLAGLAAAGFLTYELIKAYQNQLKGCWQATSDGKSVTKVKIGSLTCDSCCNSNGNLGDLATVCDPSNQPASASCKCIDCSGIVKGCQCGSSCGSGETNLCSMWCSNTVRITKDPKGNTYAYQCNDPSFFDTIADIAGHVDDAISDLFGEVSSFLKNLLKYGLWAILFVGACILIYIAYKFISPIFSGHSEGGDGHVPQPANHF